MSLRRKDQKRTRKRQGASRKTPVPGLAGAWFAKLVEVQARLRGPNGCPWDLEQTHETLRTYLIEEAYEVLEALESGQDAEFVEEMGDLLLQIVFHSQIAREQGRFTITDVVRSIHDKMRRRHPHVFGKTRARDATEVLKNWEQIKAEERLSERRQDGAGLGSHSTKPRSLLDGVSRDLPATLEGFQLTRRAARIGFDWDNADGIFTKLGEETTELKMALGTGEHSKVEEELGDLLFVAVNLARFLRADPEIALKKANAKFSRRFRQMEQLARTSGREFKDVPREEMETLWEAAKRGEQESLVVTSPGTRPKQ
jgi:MazG family protein